MPDVGRLLPHLDHQHDVPRGVEIGQAADRARKLIAEDEA
jgi:hypothetical protein